MIDEIARGLTASSSVSALVAALATAVVLKRHVLQSLLTCSVTRT